MSDDDSNDGGRITVKRERKVFQKESLVVKSKRGTGTNDRDEVRAEVVREANLDVPEGLVEQFPDLIPEREAASKVADVAQAMEHARTEVSADPE